MKYSQFISLCWYGKRVSQTVENKKWITENAPQRLDRRAPLAGDYLHELKAAAVQLNLWAVVILCVDLTGPQRTAVLRLNVRKQRGKYELKKNHELHPAALKVRKDTLYMLLDFFLGFASYTSCEQGKVIRTMWAVSLALNYAVWVFTTLPSSLGMMTFS